ncbi:MAG: N,N-dimethylformamidase beta subunit family domain-containing protein [Chitinophagaceae bacterium]
MGKLYLNRRKLMFTCLYLIATSLFSSAQNPVVTENALPGNPESEWTVPDFRDIRIAGFADKMSLNAGATVNFRVNVQGAAQYSIKIYRIGYYGGSGARLMANLGSFTGVVQAAGISNSTTGMIDCSNWKNPVSWAIPSNAVSGLYVAKLERTGGGSNHIVFIVRNDSRNSDLYLQFPDATWQAYNGYGGNSMYDGTTSWPSGHAVKVSYNRPFVPYNSLFNTDGREADWYMNAEYPMIRWLERNGYDITYTSCNDVATNGSRLLNHKIFISVGHDEYISKQQRANIEAARNAGVHMAFFSGNEVYWKTRWENNDGTEDRTLVCYKEGFLADGTLGERACGSKCDPSAEWTGLWRTGADYDAGTPENKLTGQLSWTEYPANIIVPAFYKKIRLWRNTSVATLPAGQSASLGVNTLGYEWDYEQPGFASTYPEGRFTASSTNVNNLNHKLSLYRHSSGALVFGAGTVQWSWGLDGNHLGGSTDVSIAMQQATANLFADMGAQPGKLQSDLTAPIKSTDFTAPSASFTSPANASTFSTGTAINFTGGATDAGGGVVASVEISTDGGARWIPATLNSIDGTITWSYSWTPVSGGTYTIYARGVDDSGNIGNAVSIKTTIGAGGDVTPPIISSVLPPNRATGVSTTTTVTATFSEAINSSTVTANTFQVRNAANTLVNATVSTSGNQIILTPSTVLAGSATYTVTIVGGSSGVKDLAGNALVNNYTWTFTTAAAGGGGGNGNSASLFQPTDVPQAIRVNDGQSVEFGMRFRTSQDGFVTGIRFYKGAGGTGSHTGSLWTNTGTLLSQVTFINETASGWQQVLFNNPVAITPGVTYVVSCFSSSGDYAASKPYFTANLVNGPITGLQDGVDGPNGLYMYTASPAFPTASIQSSNYWVDVVFNAGSDNVAPTVTSVLPANITTDVALNTVITANFSEAINSATVTGSTFQLRDAANNVIAATVNTATSQLSLTPSAPLKNATVYTVTITGGASGVKDPAGNALASNYSWSFTTVGVDNTAPTVNIVSPASGATSVNVFTSISAIFSEAINSSSASSTTFQVKDAANTILNGSVTVSGNQLTFNPSTAFIAGKTYTVTIVGGASGVKDLAGNALANNFTWSFTTASGNPTYSFFQSTDLPQNILVNDGQGIEVGMRFRSSQNGYITGVRYYKGTGATGVHVGSLWTNTGTQLAQAAFITETPSGWQQVSFSSPVAITADVTYVISCFSPSGDYASSKPYFTDNLVNPPITGLKDGFDGPNGLYMYAAASVFPTSSFQASNYWVDVVFSSTNGTGTVAPSVTTQPVSQTLCAGTTATFTSMATGTPTPTVQWQVSTGGTSWTNITGATNATLSFTVVAGDNGKQYRAVWTNSTSSVNSNAATLTVNAIPATPGVTVVNSCGSSVLTAGSFTGSLLWSNGATTSSITVTTAGAFTVTQTANGCKSSAGSGTAAPGNVAAPTVTVVNSCGSSTLKASGYTGSLLWSNGATTASITVYTPGTYTVTQKVNNCTSAAGSGTAVPVTPAPKVAVVNNCGSSTLTASDYTGALRWSNGATTASITVIAGGTYTVKQTINGCTSAVTSVTATPGVVPTAPTITVVNNCGSSTLTAGGYTGSLLWSNGATTASITVTAAGTYTVNQTVNGCTSANRSATAAPTVNSVVAPNVTVVNNCGSSILTASGYSGSLLWSTGATTASITVTTAGTYTVTQKINTCTSPARSITAAPKSAPTLTSSLTKIISSGASVAYTATSADAISSFKWTRAAVSGIQNGAASGTGNISEILTNNATSPVNVTYVYTLTGTNGCVRTQNVMVTVNPVNCSITNTSLTSNFNSSSIPAGRYIWFYSSLNPSSLSWNNTAFTINITNAVVTFTANGVPYTLSVPNGRIRFEPNAWPASTSFTNNTWETVVPRIFSDDIFMNGLAWRVPVNLPGNISNVKWTANITMDKPNTSLTWRWSAAVYTVFNTTAGVKPKPVSGIFWDAYFNFDEAGTTQNYEQYLVSGARNSGRSNDQGSYVTSTSLSCSTGNVATRPGGDADTTIHTNTPVVPDLPKPAITHSLGSKDLQAEAMPNPSSTYFNLVIRGTTESPVTVRILDMFGQVVEVHQKLASNTILQVGNKLASGSYFAEITQGDQRKIVRIIKAN